MGTFTTATVGQCEHRCLSALGLFKTAEKTGKALGSSRQKKDKKMMLLERSLCVKFLKSLTAESI